MCQWGMLPYKRAAYYKVKLVLLFKCHFLLTMRIEILMAFHTGILDNNRFICVWNLLKSKL